MCIPFPNLLQGVGGTPRTDLAVPSAQAFQAAKWSGPAFPPLPACCSEGFPNPLKVNLGSTETRCEKAHCASRSPCTDSLVVLAGDVDLILYGIPFL